MSQLDLALTAAVSARHVSFLETARSRPSRQMVLRLGSALDLSMRERNALLVAAGMEPAYGEPDAISGLAGPVGDAVNRMLDQHEPFPMVVMDRHYDIVRTNQGADGLFSGLIARPEALQAPLNIYRAVFDPKLVRPFIVDWERLAHDMLSRLVREVMARPGDEGLAELLDGLLAFPGVPASWRQPELFIGDDPVATVELVRDDLALRFLTTVTAFNAPQNVTVEELRIESYFPLDEQTGRHCRELVAGSE